MARYLRGRAGLSSRTWSRGRRSPPAEISASPSTPPPAARARAGSAGSSGSEAERSTTSPSSTSPSRGPASPSKRQSLTALSRDHRKAQLLRVRPLPGGVLGDQGQPVAAGAQRDRADPFADRDRGLAFGEGLSPGAKSFRA